MMVTALLAMAAATAAQGAAASEFLPSSTARATATVSVRLLTAEVVPMSAESRVQAEQRRTTLRLADGEHDAFIVELQ